LPRYDEILGPLNVTARDFYSQLIPTPRDAKIYADVNYSDCGEFGGFIGGLVTTQTWVGGTATFNQMSAVCKPGYSLQIEISLDNLINQTVINFQPCLDGDPDAEAEQCSCPDGDSCAGERIILNPGEWLVGENAYTVQLCTNPDPCLGGAAVGEESCMEGYEGAYCGDCKHGYYPDVQNSVTVCVKCGSPSSYAPSLVIIPVLVATFLFIAVVVYSFLFATGRVRMDNQNKDYMLMKAVKIVSKIFGLATRKRIDVDKLGQFVIAGLKIVGVTMQVGWLWIPPPNCIVLGYCEGLVYLYSCY